MSLVLDSLVLGGQTLGFVCAFVPLLLAQNGHSGAVDLQTAVVSPEKPASGHAGEEMDPSGQMKSPSDLYPREPVNLFKLLHRVYLLGRRVHRVEPQFQSVVKMRRKS
jgi:hypothetical protein